MTLFKQKLANLLHGVPTGFANEMNVIIELARYSKNKYEIDKDTGLIALDRVMHTSQDCPFGYGFASHQAFLQKNTRKTDVFRF